MTTKTDLEALRLAAELTFDRWLDDAGSIEDAAAARAAYLDAATDPTKLPRLEVPGDLWNGAPARVTWEGWSDGPNSEWCEDTYEGTWHNGGLVVDLQSGTEWLDCDEEDTFNGQTSVELRLDDELGLGLEGLKARLRQRIPDGWPSGWLADVRGLPAYPVSSMNRKQVCDVASAIALSDHLAALLGQELEDGEVAQWFWHKALVGWMLKVKSKKVTHDGGVLFSHLPPVRPPMCHRVSVKLDGDAPPLYALRAVIEDDSWRGEKCGCGELLPPNQVLCMRCTVTAQDARLNKETSDD